MGRKSQSIGIKPDIYSHLKISPDGRYIAFTVGQTSHSEIKLWDLDRNNLIQLTSAANPSLFPLWSPNGRRIAFASFREGIPKVYWKETSGTGKVETIELNNVDGFIPLPSALSGDGKTLLFTELKSTVGVSDMCDIGVLKINGESEYNHLLKDKYNEFDPKISPDGRWMAYTSNESGKYEVYVLPFPNLHSGEQLKVSTEGGHSPLWAPDGDELFYRYGDSVMAVSVERTPTFHLGTPKILFRENYAYPVSILAILRFNSWDIHPNGKQFIMMRFAGGEDGVTETAVPRKINIVLNWFEELKDRVPAN